MRVVTGRPVGPVPGGGRVGMGRRPRGRRPARRRARARASRGVAAMTRLAAVVRGMRQRGGTTIMILAVALVATAAAAAGPIYYQAARTSILRDTVASSGFSGRGYEANETGALPGLLGQLAPAVRSQLGHGLGSLAGRGCSPRPSRRSSLPDLSAVPDVDTADLAERRVPAPDQRPLPGRPGTSAGQPQNRRSHRLAPRPAGALRRLADLHDHRPVPGARPGPRVLVRPGLDLLLGYQPDRCPVHCAGHPRTGPPATAGPRGRG